MTATIRAITYCITTFSKAEPSDRYHARRYWCEVRRDGTDDIVHATAEYVVPTQASAAAEKWVHEHGGRVIGRPHQM